MPNFTVPDDGQWNSKPAWKLPGWCEPVMVATILFGAMFLTRKRDYRVFDRSAPRQGLLDGETQGSTDHLLAYPSDSDSELDDVSTAKNPPKVRDLGCCKVTTPNTSRFRNNIHSRILQRFPFLNEMLYWIINYAFYRMTSIMSSKLFAGRGIWDVAQEHGISVLEAEEYGMLKFLFPVRERDVQQWFMHGHQDALTVLNKCYALIHIPGTVGFICWYYYVAPSFDTFAIARRTLTLTNFCAFLTFVVYPCMPPRLLPKEYGFLDTVRHDDAQSVWMSGKFVNQLAAMPSMHFGYSFCIGMTMIYHSGIFRRTLERGEVRKNIFWKLFYLSLGFGYPTFILVTIVATANHYFMDAMVATCFVFISFLCNKVFYVFIPLEDLFLYAIRADKPIPTTGERFHDKGGRL
ncbi:PAP2 superfamily-domain-containing protein [Paraphoma chrysanthemicola]|uniref:PAP2 superfamily-domain-containing protein n=1 Tax=Paraphoma chrysanthemicola TaxID=798071 RepID=A0A8K0QW95_9PLEO|nr:PAP2 superfamily-domain-containing protein [Paraphoma chrysanthemicola]